MSGDVSGSVGGVAPHHGQCQAYAKAGQAALHRDLHLVGIRFVSAGDAAPSELEQVSVRTLQLGQQVKQQLAQQVERQLIQQWNGSWFNKWNGSGCNK